MNNNLIIHEARTNEEIALFWDKRNAYMREDILPNCTMGFFPKNMQIILWDYITEILISYI